MLGISARLGTFARLDRLFKKTQLKDHTCIIALNCKYLKLKMAHPPEEFLLDYSEQLAIEVSFYFQLKAHLPLADRKSNTYNLTLE